MFDPAYPIARLKPAPYNPRILDAAARERLRASLRDLGQVKPVIITATNTILAGHQRTSVMSDAGYTTTATFIIDHPVTMKDEIRFNQLHNASDLELGDAQLRVPPQPLAGIYVDIPHEALTGALRVKNAAKKAEILRLLTLHGEWGSIVVNQSGEVLVSRLYAICCKILGMPCKAFVVPDTQRDLVLEYFGQQYGRFSYAALPKTTFAQGWAQMMRLRSDKQGGHSRTYDALVIPRLTKTLRVLDFGAGQKDYATKLGKQGYNILPVEFFKHSGNTLLIGEGQRDVDNLCRDLSAKGRFDLVICDSVLNSVDSQQAEQDVLTTINAFCKPGGTIIFSGRSREKIDDLEFNMQATTDLTRYVNFLDEHGISAIYSQGVWRYQKFHTLNQAKVLAHRYFGPTFTVYGAGGKLAKTRFRESSWGIVATKSRDVPESEVRASLAREFNLPLPGGKSYGRDTDILRAWEKALTL